LEIFISLTFEAWIISWYGVLMLFKQVIMRLIDFDLNSLIWGIMVLDNFWGYCGIVVL
jgi:hypothetical protein